MYDTVADHGNFRKKVTEKRGSSNQSLERKDPEKELCLLNYPIA